MNPSELPERWREPIIGHTSHVTPLPCVACAAEAHRSKCADELDAALKADPVATAINELAKLPHGWNSYDSPPMTEAALLSARKIAEALRTLVHVSPVPGGGIQFEWHGGGADIEIEVMPNGSVETLVTVDDVDYPTRIDDPVARLEALGGKLQGGDSGLAWVVFAPHFDYEYLQGDKDDLFGQADITAAAERLLERIANG